MKINTWNCNCSLRSKTHLLDDIDADVDGTNYVEEYVSYRSVEDEGKGIPRYFDHLDWDGDGADEILLDVFGANRRWFSALDRTDDQWTRSFDAECGSGSTTVN